MFLVTKKVKGEGPNMKDLNSTLLRPFFESIDPIDKQNHKEIVGVHVWAIIAINRTISDEEN